MVATNSHAGTIISRLPQNPHCSALYQNVLAPSGDDHKLRMKTDSFIYLGPNRAGQIVRFDSHNQPFGADTPHPLWSATKAVTTAMAARAIQLGLLNPDAKVVDVLGRNLTLDLRERALRRFLRANPQKASNPELEKSFAEITVQHVMEMTTGLDWFEHEDHGLSETSSMNMLYGPGSKNVFEYVMGLPMKFVPGRAWNYSSGNTVILSAILKRIAGSNYPQRLLFKPLGMTSGFIERDATGLPIGSSFGYLSANDMLKLGEVFLSDGKWQGKRFFPKDWMKKASTASLSFRNPETDAKYVEKEKMVYGVSLAVNQGFPDRGISTPFPNAPQDLFFAAGHFGQLIIVIPSRSAIIVRTGFDSHYWSNVGAIANLSLACFTSDPSEPSTIVAHESEKTKIKQRLNDLKYFVRTGMLANAMAKEICSCAFINGIDPKTCLKRNHVPGMASGFQSVAVDPFNRVVTISPNSSTKIQNIGFAQQLLDAKGAKAKYSPQPQTQGCVLDGERN